jgi:tRNA 2-selenouridine synthase
MIRGATSKNVIASQFINKRLFLVQRDPFSAVLLYPISSRNKHLCAVPVIRTDIHEFIALAKRIPVADVRSPGEYDHGHIPGAHSLPLFSDDERKMIGTAYKQESRQKAIKVGLEAFGRKMVALVELAERLTVNQQTKEIAIHCWRGGMRSGAVAWLLDLYGFKVYTLNGGYKSWRRFAVSLFTKPWKLNLLGGYTGSNKTGIVHLMLKEGLPVIDLEALAVHRGSAFGNLDQLPQPTQEHFENLLATALHNLDHNAAIWLEAESQRLGLINIPNDFFVQMRGSPLYFLDIPFAKRLDHILSDYSKYEKEKIVNAIMRIKKKLGGLETKNAVNFIIEDDIRGCFGILLKYYDKLYLRSTREPEGPPNGQSTPKRHVIYIESPDTDAGANLKKLLKHA